MSETLSQYKQEDSEKYITWIYSTSSLYKKMVYSIKENNLYLFKRHNIPSALGGDEDDEKITIDFNLLQEVITEVKETMRITDDIIKSAKHLRIINVDNE